MRSRTLLRTSSSQSVCVFCACRLAGELSGNAVRAPLLAQQRRGIGSTPRSGGGFGLAPAESGNNGGFAPAPAAGSFDPDSSLTAEERNMIAARRARQQAAEEQRRAAERQQEEERQAAFRGQRQRDEEDRRRFEQHDAALKARSQQRVQGQSGSMRRGTGNDRGSLIRKHGAGPGDASLPLQRNNQRGDPRNNWQAAGQQRTRQPQRVQVDMSQRQGKRKQQQGRQIQPLQPTKKVEMPEWLKSKQPETVRKPAMSGWGAGATERAPLQYAVQTEPQRVPVPDPDPELKPPQQSANITDPPVAGEMPEPVAESAPGPVQPRGFGLNDSLPETSNLFTAPSREPEPQLEAKESESVRGQGNVNSQSHSIHDILNVDFRQRFQQQDQRPPAYPAQPERGSARDYSTYDPPQQAQHGQRNAHGPPMIRFGGVGQNGYRTTPFNASEEAIHDSAESQPAENWQHLRRRQSESAAPPSLQQQAQPSHDGYTTPEASIDDIFARHQQERVVQPPTRKLQPNTQWNAPPPPGRNDRQPSRQRQCGRCGERGHIARECPRPIQIICHKCKKEGHSMRDCPERRTPVSHDPFADQQQVPQRTQYERQRASRPSYNQEEEQPGRRKREDREERESRYSKDPRVQMMRSMQKAGTEEDAPEEPAERVLRSRKFRDPEDDAAEYKDSKKKPGRRSRRDQDEEDERPRRGGRDFADGDEEDFSSARRDRQARKAEKKKAERAAERATQEAEARNQIRLPEFISVQNLGQALGVRYEQFVTRLEDLGYDDIFPGKIFNSEVSGLIAMEYDLEPVFEDAKEEDERDLKARPEVAPEDKEFLPTRPPVVTIMGHVDHGKTTILDHLRKSSVAAGEAGGITQHIGAFSVPLASSGRTITFLDTPGHAAFLAMRQRGANVTDIVILVVAADDSVKPQTLEAIKHAKAAGVPMIVAVNKVDKEEADVQRVKQDLARHGVEIEDFGGETQVVPVSGKSGQGMDELEENLVALSETLDHRAEADGIVEGWVLEATTKKAGRVATVLVRRGTLRQGALLVAGKTWARVRTLRNEAGVTIKEASPGMPVEVDGWRDQPAAGDEVLQAPTEQKANSVVEYRLEKEERGRTAQDMEAINEARRLEQEKRERERRAQLAPTNEEEPSAPHSSPDTDTTSSGKLEVPFIIKADVSGSAEAVAAYIQSVSSPLIAPRILASTVGNLHESDIELASAAQGHIIAFNLPPDEGMKAMAESRSVKVLENNIIYRVLDDVKAVLEDKLPPVVSQRVLGEAEVGAAFDIGLGGRKKMKIAGCKVRNGLIGRGARVRVMRGEQKIYDGLISSLKNVKKDVTEMRKGSECGMGFEGWEGFEVGDQIQTYEERSERRTL